MHEPGAYRNFRMPFGNALDALSVRVGKDFSLQGQSPCLAGIHRCLDKRGKHHRVRPIRHRVVEKKARRWLGVSAARRAGEKPSVRPLDAGAKWPSCIRRWSQRRSNFRSTRLHWVPDASTDTLQSG